MNSIKHYQAKIQKLQETTKNIYNTMAKLNDMLMTTAVQLEHFNGDKSEKAIAKNAAARCRLAIKYLKADDFRGDISE